VLAALKPRLQQLWPVLARGLGIEEGLEPCLVGFLVRRGVEPCLMADVEGQLL
jgi:hypothetical protein